MRSLLLYFLLLTSFSAQAYENIPDHDVLVQIDSQAPVSELSSQFTLISWNIEKAKKQDEWFRDFETLERQSDIFFLQEGMEDDYLPEVLSTLNGWDWWMARAWRNKEGHSTGVMTGGRVKSRKNYFLRSPNNEPIANTPKMALLQIYRLETGEPILFVNIHGINFVLNSIFRKQIDQILGVMDPLFEKNPDLKVVFGGDFNTWNGGRTRYVVTELEKRGFVQVAFQLDRRNLKLDHIFVKGCEISKAHLFSDIKTSDHAPIQVDIDCDKTTGVHHSVPRFQRM